MRKVFVGIFILFLVASSAYAQDRGTAAEAKSLLSKAVAYYKANGQAKDLYIFALDMSGKIIAHGVNAALIGKDMMGTKDADGKLFIKEMVNIGKTKGKGSVDYKWVSPKTNKVEQKSSYIEKVNRVVLGCGFYK
jgi:signal transduction histidine kinase